MEMKVLEILVNLLQNEEEEEDLPEQVSVKNLYWLCQKEIHNKYGDAAWNFPLVYEIVW